MNVSRTEAFLKNPIAQKIRFISIISANIYNQKTVVKIVIHVIIK